MKKYLKIMRLDHWIKQLFVLPGVFVALLLIKIDINSKVIINIIIGMLSTCFIASSNYVINEWLDAKYDKYHPTKKYRSVVQNDLKSYIVYILYVVLVIIGLILSTFISKIFFLLELCLFITGILYNVPPIRLKDIVFVDALFESINNALRFLLGWFIVTNSYLPTISIVIGYWFAGAFLMEVKRYSEYRMINNKELASKYRKSFKYYNEENLLVMSFFYAMCSVFFIGIFLIKYRIELLLFIPFYIGLFCYYLNMSFKADSSAQKPEKLFKEKGLMLYMLFLLILFIVLLKVDIPALGQFVNDTLIKK